jgi:hypothetical protein
MGASEALGACLRDRCLGERFQIHCRGLDGRWITLNHVASTTSVRTLKFMLHCKTRLPPEDFVLVYRSKLLQPDKTLAASGITQDAGLQVLGRLRGGASSKGDGSLAEAAERPSRCYAVCTPSEREGFAVRTLYTVRSTGTSVRRAEVEIATDPWLAELLRSRGEEAYGVEFDMMHHYPPTTGSAAGSARTVRPLSPPPARNRRRVSTAPRLPDQPSHGSRSVPFQAIGFLSCRASRPPRRRTPRNRRPISGPSS